MTKFKDKMNSYKKHPGSFLLLLLVVAAAIITVARKFTKGDGEVK